MGDLSSRHDHLCGCCRSPALASHPKLNAMQSAPRPRIPPDSRWERLPLHPAMRLEFSYYSGAAKTAMERLWYDSSGPTVALRSATTSRS